MIQVENVSKTYNNAVLAVDQLNLTVNDGEIVGFIGANGAGKTTTLKMMTGILKPIPHPAKVKDMVQNEQ